MKTLKLPTTEITIEKTGLPFYDAARLIGAAHRHASTAGVVVRDEGSRWVLDVPQLAQERELQQLVWVLEALPANAPSTKNLRSTVEQHLRSKQQTVDAAQPAKGKKAAKSESAVYYYLESALQTGIRGADPLASYRKLASQAGTEFPQPIDDVVDAAFGVSFAAISLGRPEEGERRVLPILGTEHEHLVLQPFLDFRRTYRHQAGVFVASVWASLALLDELTGHDLPVVDFAYNWGIPRVQSASGYVGVGRICDLMRKLKEERKRKEEGREFFLARQVRRYLAGTAWQGDATEHDLARALAHFVTSFETKHLETVVRLKARLLARGEAQQDRFAQARARAVLTGATIREVQELMRQEVDIPWGLTQALARWFAGGGSKGWIGNYIKLENTSSGEGFLDVAERILSRAQMNTEAPVRYSPPRDEQTKLQWVRALRGSEFRGFKAQALLDVLARMRVGGSTGTEQTPAVGDTGTTD